MTATKRLKRPRPHIRPHLRPRLLLLLLPALLVCSVCACCLLQFAELPFADLAQFAAYESTQIPSARAERVKVDDVIAAREFIAAAASTTHRRAFAYYNKARSDKIGAFRALPDTRDATCATRSYRIPSRRTRVSVIISFHNEARSTLLRTIMSVYRRSPRRYLHEIILIDDCSEDVALLPALLRLNFPPFARNFTAQNQMPLNSSSPGGTPPAATTVAIKTLRNWRRAGVIASRNRGARLATGDYLLFLDSHCEVNVGWLEPLLERVATGMATAASPVLDSIDAASLTYAASSAQLVGGFDWNLHFHWVPRRRQNPGADAFKSPTFAGGIFMISRNWFFKLNAFNALLQVWGGEAIEFSIKLWLCGGQIEIVPCSRVGHIFRQRHSFSFPNGDDGHATYLRNSKIIAESWLDAYKHIFYASKPAAKQIPVNISHAALRRLKRDLGCRPFAWYLQNVFTQLGLPNDDFIAFGTLSSEERCLHIDQLPDSFAPLARSPYLATPLAAHLVMASCYASGISHWFLHRQTLQLRSSSSSDGCLSVLQLANRSTTGVAAAHLRAVLQPCHQAEPEQRRQRWLRRGAQLVHQHTQLCLDNPLRDSVTVSHCRDSAPSQLFRFSMELQRL